MKVIPQLLLNHRACCNGSPVLPSFRFFFLSKILTVENPPQVFSSMLLRNRGLSYSKVRTRQFITRSGLVTVGLFPSFRLFSDYPLFALLFPEVFVLPGSSSHDRSVSGNTSSNPRPLSLQGSRPEIGRGSVTPPPPSPSPQNFRPYRVPLSGQQPPMARTRDGLIQERQILGANLNRQFFVYTETGQVDSIDIRIPDLDITLSLKLLNRDASPLPVVSFNPRPELPAMRISLHFPLFR